MQPNRGAPYRPPHLRTQSNQSAASFELSPHGPNLQPRRLSELPSNELTVQAIHDHFHPGIEPDDIRQSPLNATLSYPDRLGYVILFPVAISRWRDDRIIFAKTNLELLPAFEQAIAKEDSDILIPSKATIQLFSDTSWAKPDPTQDGHPVAVFEEMLTYRNVRSCSYVFTGWFDIERVQFRKPGSEELVHMLKTMWSKKDSAGQDIHLPRDQETWDRNCCHRWAVIKMRRLRVQPAPPQITVGARGQ